VLDHYIGLSPTGKGEFFDAEPHGYGDGFQERYRAFRPTLLGDERQFEDLLGRDVPCGQCGEQIVGYLSVAQFYGDRHRAGS
jgi:hypothetical protein